MNPSMRGMFGLTLTALLRNPDGLMQDDPRAALRRHGLALLSLIVGSSVVFGLVLGSYRGGLQLAYAALKAPWLWFAPLLVALPAVHAAYRACGIDVSHARVVVASLIGFARAGVALAVASPALWLAYSIDLDYHVAVVLLCGALLLGGLLASFTMARCLPGSGLPKKVAHASGLLAMGLVLAQSGWLLRPFLVRPRSEIAFLRPVESHVFESVGVTWRSSRGRYDGWDPQRRGLLASPEPEPEPEPEPMPLPVPEKEDTP